MNEDTMDTVSVPDFQPQQTTGGETHFTPLQSPAPKSSKKSLLVGITLAIAVILPVAGYFVYTQTQSTDSQAAMPACHTGAPPLAPDPACYTGSAPTSLGDSNWTSCGAPAEGTCKKKNGACYECRDKFEGLRIICSCTGETPTPTTSQECQAPAVCVDPSQAGTMECGADSNAATMCSRDGSLSPNGICCKPKEQPTCPAPKSCVGIDPKVGDISKFCEDGTMDPDASTAACAQGTVCCVPRPTPTPNPTPTVVTPTPTETPTPTVTQACILPQVTVKVTCATCSSPQQ